MSRNAIALSLSKETGKSPRTAWSWFDAGMPSSSLEEAREWVAVHRPHREKKDPAPESPVPVDTGFDSTAPLPELLESHPKQIDAILTMREAGVALGKIAFATGFSASLVSRILRTHPRAKEIDRSSSLDDWREIRRLAASRLRQALEDPATKIRPQELCMIAAISTDKVDASETAAVPAVSVRQRILAMSHEEIIRMITDGEAVIESSKTTIISAPPTPAQLPHGDELRGAGKEIKTQVICNKVEQLPAPDPAAIR